MTRVRKGRQSNWAVFGPLVWLALASVFGLFIALTGEGARDVVAWITLGAPVAVAIWATSARRR